ncbi:PH domain-containing protein [Candidatus Uhrbacteria bacterium]|nr:PH domain-containing protein [Candidatus Uhrbacteria bacterium]
MFHLEDVLQLKEGENVVRLTRRHVLTLAPGLILALILIVLPFFLLFPLFSLGVLGVMMFGISVLIGIGIAYRTFVLWDADVLLMTTHRLVDVDQKGLFTRNVTEAQMQNIQDVSWSKKGIWETIFRMGSVSIQTAGASSNIEAIKVSEPQRLAEFLNDIRHQTAPKKTVIDPEKYEKMKTIQTMLQQFSLEELERIETILKARERQTVTDAFMEDAKKTT